MTEQAYLHLMEKIWNEGELRRDRTGVGTRSLFGEQLVFDLRQGFPLLTTKRIHTRSVFAELIWFLNGRSDNQWLNEAGVTIWDEWATEEQCARFGREPGDLGPIYGHQWRNFGGEYDEGTGGIDQITRLIDGIRQDPMGRRHIVTGWNPAEADKVALPPCHTLFQCYVHVNGTLDLKLYARSIDFFLGAPFNIASYALLTHLIAWQCGLKAGRFIFSFGDVHLYLNHADQVRTQLARTIVSPPRLILQGSPDHFPHLYGLDIDIFRIEGYNPHPTIPAPVAV